MAAALVWFRRDLRLADNPALHAAVQQGYAVIPVYIHAPDEDAPWAPGAASRTWLARSLTELNASLVNIGSRLIIRRGPSLPTLEKLCAETGAEAVFWNRAYEPTSIARDSAVKSGLRAAGRLAHSFSGNVLFEPWTIKTGAGTPYRVFTPFWKTASTGLALIAVCPALTRLPRVEIISESIETLALVPEHPEPSWDAPFWQFWQPGERGAMDLLDAFIDGALSGYGQQRDLPDRIGTSRLSPHLHFGEISPRQIVGVLQSQTWPAAMAADVQKFIAELGWREFSRHVLFHFPTSCDEDFNPRFARFPWAKIDEANLQAWQQGRTGVPLVDAGMRELWQTGWMHNRVRMIVASFFCKHLRYYWQHGARWFWQTLLDADLANNSQGWQWCAGTGVDAAPYYRVFNPASQARRFDPSGRYLRRWLPELSLLPDHALAAPWEHPELLHRLAPNYPQQPIVDLAQGRNDALAALAASKRQ